jgi:hypothetical protein
MNAVIAPNFTGLGFSSFRKPGKLVETAQHFRLLIFDASSALQGGMRGLAPAAPAGIAESVRELTVEAAASLPTRLRQRIVELAGLQDNWDEEGANPVKPHILAEVVETLRRLSQQTIFREPFLAPTFDGFVQLEWHDEKRWLDLETTEDGWSAVGTTITPQGKRLYYTADFKRSDFAKLETFYRWLLSDEFLTWPSL